MQLSLRLGKPRTPAAATPAPAPEPEPRIPAMPTLYRCVRLLSGLDQDRAGVRNDIGWNGNDTGYGHHLAEKPQERWTAWDVFNAYRLCFKYRRTQLAAAGLRFDLIDPPAKPTEPELVRELSIGEDGWFEVKLDDHTYRLPEFIDARMGLPGRRWDPSRRVTRIAPDAAGARALFAFLERFKYTDHPFRVEPDVEERFDQLYRSAERMVAMSRAVKPSDGWQRTSPFTFDAQEAGIEYLLTGMAQRLATGQGSGVLIGDDMGTGKTACALLAAYRAGAFTDGILGRTGMLVISPATVKLNWRLEAYHWLGRCIDPHCTRGPEDEDGVRHPAHRLGPDGREARWDRLHGCWDVEEPLVPDLKVDVIDGAAAQPIFGQVVIVNYDVLRWRKDSSTEVNDITLLLSMRSWAAVVADECHRCKNPESMRTEVVSQVMRSARAPFCVGMSGTSVLNRTSEVVPQLEMLEAIEHFGSASQFEQRYVYGEQKDRKELNRKMRELGIYLQRPKRAQVIDPSGFLMPLDRVPLDHLPASFRIGGNPENTVAKERLEDAQVLLEGWRYEWIPGAMDYILSNRVEQVEIMAADPKVLPEYEQCLKEFREWYRTELQGKFGEDDWQDRWSRGLNGEMLVQLGKLREVTARVKIASVARWADGVIEQGEKLVMFTCFDESRQYLLRKLAGWNPATVFGGMSPAAKQKEIARFQNDPNCGVIVLQLLSGGEGINLTAARHCAIVETYWNGGMIDQAAARIDRGGQGRDVTIWHLYADQTIDREMAMRCQAKAEETAAVINGGEVESSKLWADLMKIALGEAA